MRQLRDLQALIVDMDGVLYRGETAIAGAPAFLAWLDERAIPFLCVTNNSTLDPQAYERKLARMGIAVPARRILTSSQATAEYLAGRYPPGTHIYMIGESGLERALGERGYVLTDDRPAAVVVGLDRQVTYAQLRTASLAIRAGAAFVATNPDRTLPTEAGEEPGAGALIAALVAATGREPVMIGKPEPPLMELAIGRLGQPRERIGALGDRVETDILSARRLGLPGILVLSGGTQAPPPPEDETQPDWVFASVRELHRAWQESLGQSA